MKNGIYESDFEELKAIKNKLQRILEYYYGDNPTRKYWRRLDTIVIKLNELIALLEQE